MKRMEWLRKKAAAAPEREGEPAAGWSRRAFLRKLGIGGLLGALLWQGYALLRALVPNVLYEDPKRFKAGLPDQFPEGSTFLEDKRVYIFREQKVFYAISGVCTHLGCTVKMVGLSQPKKVLVQGKPLEERREFHCPCHGSRYYGDGTNYAGPAPAPLAWHLLEISPDDGQLIVNLSESVSRNFRLVV